MITACLWLSQHRVTTLKEWAAWHPWLPYRAPVCRSASAVGRSYMSAFFICLTQNYLRSPARQKLILFSIFPEERDGKTAFLLHDSNNDPYLVLLLKNILLLKPLHSPMNSGVTLSFFLTLEFLNPYFGEMAAPNTPKSDFGRTWLLALNFGASIPIVVLWLLRSAIQVISKQRQ